MLSKITIEQDGTSVESLALAPVSVARGSEKGIGGKLIVGCIRKSERTWIRISCSIGTSSTTRNLVLRKQVSGI